MLRWIISPKRWANKPGSLQLNDMQKAYFFDLLSDLFNFYSIDQAYKRLLRLMDEDLYKLFPKQLAEYKALAPHVRRRLWRCPNVSAISIPG